MAEQPKSGFYIAVAAVVLALIGFAVWRSDLVAPKPLAPPGMGEGQAKIDPKEVAQPVESSQDTTSPTTVKEYRFKPAEKLPPVKGIAAYKPLEKNTVRFALNVWAGWAPIVLANNGFKAGQEWTAGDGQKFKVELVLIDNPVARCATPMPPARFPLAGRLSTWSPCSCKPSSTAGQPYR